MTEQSPEAAAQAIRREALKLAVEYHAELAQSPTTKGGASATAVTATASEFATFLRRVADRAGVDADDLDSKP